MGGAGHDTMHGEEGRDFVGIFVEATFGFCGLLTEFTKEAALLQSVGTVDGGWEGIPAGSKDVILQGWG